MFDGPAPTGPLLTQDAPDAPVSGNTATRPDNLLRSAFISTLHCPFWERAARISQVFDDARTGPNRSLVMRKVLSPTDREVTILDPLTNTPRTMLMFGANNYLGLANHPHIGARVHDVIDRYGFGHGGAGLLNGYTQHTQELEERISALKGAEATILFSSGYAANLGLLSIALVNRNAVILCDERHHASFFDGVKLSGFPRSVRRFRHNDADHVAELLAAAPVHEGNTFVAMEGVYSMDGDVAPLDRIAPLCRKAGAIMLLDDAHGTGSIGKTGRGVAEHFNLLGDIDITVTTFSKALAAMGGAVSGPQDVVDYLRLAARSSASSVSLTRGVAVAVLAALEVLEAEPERVRQLRAIVDYAATELARYNLPVAPQDPQAGIILLPVPPGMPMRTAALAFHEAGIFVNAVEFPAVPADAPRFRLSFMATHTHADVDQLVAVAAEIWERFAPEWVGVHHEPPLIERAVGE